MSTRQSGHVVLIVAIIIIVIGVLGLLGWFFWQNFNKASGSAVTTFEQCKTAPGSKILETYPEQCVTSDGRSFTGPTNEDKVAKKTYCTKAEKICFEYRDDWVITELAIEGAEPGAKADRIEIASPNREMILTLESGIGGLGGSCPDEFKVPVTVLEATPAASMTGFGSDFSLPMLQVARVYYPQAGGDSYTTALYLTGASEYSVPGTLSACGIGFSEFMAGRNAVLSSDFSGAGSFRFGYFGSLSDNPQFYDSEAEAKAAFETDIYKQAALLLASAHYE